MISQWLKINKIKATVYRSTLKLSTIPTDMGDNLTANTNYSRNEYFFARKKTKSFKIIAQQKQTERVEHKIVLN